MAFICHYHSRGCSGNVDVCPTTVREDGFIWCSHGAAALVWCQCPKEQISTCCVSMSGITVALWIHSRFPGHTWAHLAEPSDCMFNEKAVHSHINAFPCFWRKPYIIWGEVESLRHPPSISFFKSSTFNALKVMIFFLPTCRGSLSGERKRERHCQEMSQLCSTRDLTIPSDLLIFGRRSADIKSKMLLLEKHGAVQTERVQHWGTVT